MRSGAQGEEGPIVGACGTGDRELRDHGKRSGKVERETMIEPLFGVGQSPESPEPDKYSTDLIDNVVAPGRFASAMD